MIVYWLGGHFVWVYSFGKNTVQKRKVIQPITLPQRQPHPWNSMISIRIRVSYCPGFVPNYSQKCKESMKVEKIQILIRLLQQPPLTLRNLQSSQTQMLPQFPDRYSGLVKVSFAKGKCVTFLQNSLLSMVHFLYNTQKTDVQPRPLLRSKRFPFYPAWPKRPD